MKELSIVWLGFHSEGVKAFKKILERGFHISKFITLDDEVFEKRAASTREYVDICKNFNVPIGLISTIKKDEAYEMIKDMEPDLLVVLGWSEILPERVLDIPTIGTVGAHASMLPHNRGSAPINWAIIKGETECGNSLIWLNKGVDQGDIIDQMGFEITKYDTCATLYDNVADTNEKMLVRFIERLSNGEATIMCKKNVTDEEILPRRYPKDGLINWNQKSSRIYDFIRALSRPYPGAFTFLDGQKYLIWNASILPTEDENKEIGKIIGNVYSPLYEACGIQVSCKQGYIIIHDLEDEYGDSYVGRELIDLGLNGIFSK